jgi:pimeloyl-ACP methyl ester carboxylesterase
MRMAHVDLGDLRVAYRRTGEGPPILLLHGAVCDSRVWRLALAAFASQFTVVAWDAPGCGRSSDPPPSFRMGEFADCLAAFIDVLELDRPHVLGHSWGSALALELYRRRPSDVRSLTLVGGYAGWAGSLPPDEVRRRLGFALDVAAAIESDGWDPSTMPGLFSDVMPRDQARELAAIMSEIRPAGTRTMAHALAEADLRDVLGKITAPTLLVYGEADERSPLGVARALHRAIPGSTLTVLPGLGHECYLEDPLAFEVAVREFLHDR